MAHTVAIVLGEWFPGEKSGELLVKTYQVLGVFPSLVLVLNDYRQDIYSGRAKEAPTVFSRERSAQPRKTYASFQTRYKVRHEYTARCNEYLLTEIMGVVHAGVHTLS